MAGVPFVDVQKGTSLAVSEEEVAIFPEPLLDEQGAPKSDNPLLAVHFTQLPVTPDAAIGIHAPVVVLVSM